MKYSLVIVFIMHSLIIVFIMPALIIVFILSLLFWSLLNSTHACLFAVCA